MTAAPTPLMSPHNPPPTLDWDALAQRLNAQQDVQQRKQAEYQQPLPAAFAAVPAAPVGAPIMRHESTSSFATAASAWGAGGVASLSPYSQQPQGTQRYLSGPASPSQLTDVGSFAGWRGARPTSSPGLSSELPVFAEEGTAAVGEWHGAEGAEPPTLHQASSPVAAGRRPQNLQIPSLWAGGAVPSSSLAGSRHSLSFPRLASPQAPSPIGFAGLPLAGMAGQPFGATAAPVRAAPANSSPAALQVLLPDGECLATARLQHREGLASSGVNYRPSGACSFDDKENAAAAASHDAKEPTRLLPPGKAAASSSSTEHPAARSNAPPASQLLWVHPSSPAFALPAAALAAAGANPGAWPQWGGALHGGQPAAGAVQQQQQQRQQVGSPALQAQGHGDDDLVLLRSADGPSSMQYMQSASLHAWQPDGTPQLQVSRGDRATAAPLHRAQQQRCCCYACAQLPAKAICSLSQCMVSVVPALSHDCHRQ